MGSPLLNIFELIILAVVLAGWFALFLFLRRKKRPVTAEAVHDMQIPVILLCIVILCVFLGLGSYGGGGYLEQAAPERTPANVFLLLTPDTGPEELQEWAQEQGLSCIGPIQDGKMTGYYIMVDPLYLSHKEANGVLLEVRFSGEAGSLRSAKLTIRTDAGTARCWYYPTEDTEWARPTGYTLKTKTGLLSLPRTVHPETAQAAIDLASAVVYPDGM